MEKPPGNSPTTEPGSVVSEPASVRSSAPEEGRFPAGTVLAGRYRILGLIGRGGMGEVYRAFDLILNQTVALKFLTTDLTEAALTRFRNEVRIARQVSHPNVCRVYDLGMVENLHFLSMEYVDGEDLTSLLRRIGRLPQDKAVEFARQICGGLEAAHERGILHRDLKPANIMIDGNGRARITDFGIAGLAEEIPLSDVGSGTPAYMSPEQKAGKEVTTRSDIYSLGLVLHEMFTGHAYDPSGASQPTDLVKELDPVIDRLIRRCLDTNPRARPSSALRVAMALPGGDPLAAALAAGETPSPQIVAASEEQEGLSLRAAVLCFVAMLASLAIGVAIGESNEFTARAPLDLPPDALADRAAQFLASIGYTESSAETGWACCSRAAQVNLESYPPERHDEILESHRPPAIYFWYRTEALVPGPGRPATANDPPNLDPGTVSVWLDAAGRLVRFEANPPRQLPGADSDQRIRSDEFDWQPLFDRAGLDRSLFDSVPATITPAMMAEDPVAWEGRYGPDRTETVRVEAAVWNGRPVQFLVDSVGEFSGNENQTVNQLSVGLLILNALIFGLVLGGIAYFAWRNWRSGRIDYQGAAVFTVAVTAFSSLSGGGLPNWLLTLAIWISYVALEPQVRRHWPDSLVSWTRLVQGRFASPLVASHLLVGLTAMTTFSWLGRPILEMILPMIDIPLSGESAGALTGTIDSVSILFRLLAVVFGAVLLLGLILVFRSLIRWRPVADAAAALILTLGFSLPDFEEPILFAVNAAQALAVACVMYWLLRRFGFLALLSALAFLNLHALPLQWSGWIGQFFLKIHAVPLVLAALCLAVLVRDDQKRATTTAT